MISYTQWCRNQLGYSLLILWGLSVMVSTSVFKTDGRSSNLLAPTLNIGDVAEWFIAAVFEIATGAQTTSRGFKSPRLRYYKVSL